MLTKYHINIFFFYLFPVFNINGNIVQLAAAPAAQPAPQAAPVASPTPSAVPVQPVAGVNGNNIVMVIFCGWFFFNLSRFANFYN